MLHVLQLTDLHLCTTPPKNRFDLDPRRCLEKVLHHCVFKQPQADLILLTGDLVHDEPQAYQQLIECFAGVTMPVLHLSGNHDFEIERLLYLSHPPFLNQKVWRNDQWQIIMMKSAVAGCVAGEITAQELDFVEQQIKLYPNHWSLIATHHHPIAIGSAWMDKIGILNGSQIFKRMAQCQPLKGIAFGHIHQAFSRQVGHIKIIGTPSTNRQFKPNSDHFSIDDKPLAYRNIYLHDDGSINTEVVWVDT